MPLPHQNTTAGPNAELGAFGRNVCIGNDCTRTPPADYGRYAALGAPVTVADLIATGQPLPTKSMGDSEPSAFVDDVGEATDPYLYTVHNFGSGAYSYPGTQSGVLGVARARLGGRRPLEFEKWYGPSVLYGDTSSGTFSPTSITVTGANCGPGSTATTTCRISNAGLGNDGGGLESPVFPQDPSNSPESYVTCRAGAQIQSGGSTSNATPSGGCPPKGCSACVYSGWYPTFISLGTRAGHLTKSGYAFSMNGCVDTAAGGPREYTSRSFTITSSTPGCHTPVECCNQAGGTWSDGHCR